MDSMASQITSLTIAYSAVYSGENQRKHQSSASLAFVGNSPVTGELSAQMASNAEIISIWWRHHAETAGIVELFYLYENKSVLWWIKVMLMLSGR